MVDPISDVMAVGMFLGAILCLILFFIEVKGSNFAQIILPGISGALFWGLSTYCDTGIQVGDSVFTYPFLAMVFQGLLWLCICLTLYNFGRETILKMRR